MIEQNLLVPILVAIIAALPGIYAVYNQRKKNHFEVSNALIDQLQEERNELKKEVARLKEELEQEKSKKRTRKTK